MESRNGGKDQGNPGKMNPHNDQVAAVSVSKDRGRKHPCFPMPRQRYCFFRIYHIPWFNVAGAGSPGSSRGLTSPPPG